MVNRLGGEVVVIQYPKMRCSGDCGPTAIAFVLANLGLAIDQDQVERAMDWQHHHGLGGIREDLQDSPWHHFAAIVRLGLQFKLHTCLEVRMGKAPADRTIILVHPNSRHPILAQHWVTFAGLDENKTVLVHWGDGNPPRAVPDFEEWYSRGTPACAYEIVREGGQSKLTWYQRFYVWLTGKFA